jgi:hypothetical protein
MIALPPSTDDTHVPTEVWIEVWIGITVEEKE